MTQMTQTEKEQFLAGLHVGMLAIPQDGAGPLTAPLWYQYEPGGEVWFIVGKDSRKGKLISSGTRVSLCAQDEAPPYKYVSVEGPVSDIRPAAGDIEGMAIRYLGEDMGRQYAAGSKDENNIVVSVRPERWLAVDYGKAG